MSRNLKYLTELFKCNAPSGLATIKKYLQFLQNFYIITSILLMETDTVLKWMHHPSERGSSLEDEVTDVHGV